MSYNKMMKWNKRHPKGTKQPVIMHTDSGFWPSLAFSEEWIEYATELKRQDLPFMDIKEYYNSKLR